MAPEQVSGDRSRIGPTADVYGLGAILYHVLTGRPPFMAPSIAETLDQVRDREPVPPRRLNPAIHRDIASICLKCLDKDPARRNASAGVLADDLRRFLDGRPISARPISAPEKTWRWCRRRPAIASLIAALALTLAGGFVGFFVLWRISEAEREKAETARRLSEDNERFASRALSEISGILYLALDRPESLSEDRLLALTYFLRKQTSNLRNSRGSGPWKFPGLGVLERVLANRILSRGRREEARALLIDSVAVLRECRQLDPADESTLWQLTQSLLYAGHLSVEDSANDEALAFYDQASSSLPALTTVSYRVELLTELLLSRHKLADELDGRGDSERAQRAIEANYRTIASMDASFTDKLELITPNGVTSGELLPGKHTIDWLRNATRNAPEDNTLRKAVLRCMSTLIAWEVFAPRRRLDRSRLKRFEDDPGAWAESLVSSIRSRYLELGHDADAIPISTYNVAEFASTQAARQRKIGKLGDADLTARRLMAFARMLVEHVPREPESHMVLSEAHFQVSKNAWRRLDYPTIEQGLRQALASAREAAKLAPQREDVRDLVDRLIPRLVFFDKGRSKPG